MHETPGRNKLIGGITPDTESGPPSTGVSDIPVVAWVAYGV